MRDNYHVSGSMPPCMVVSKGPITCRKIGTIILSRRRGASREVLHRVTGTCELVCRNGFDVRSTMRGVISRIPVDRRVRGVIGFIGTSRQKVIGWTGLLFGVREIAPGGGTSPFLFVMKQHSIDCCFISISWLFGLRHARRIKAIRIQVLCFCQVP